MTNNPKKENLDISLINSIASDNLINIAADGAELSIDSFMEAGLLKDIPFFGVLYKSYNAVIGIREAIFARKVYRFLRELKDIPQRKRDQFVNEMETEEGYAHKVGEKLIMIIDLLDDIEKPTIIGKLLKANINQAIDYEIFLRLSSIVQNAFLPDLEKFRLFPWPASGPRSTRISKVQYDHFVTLGIMDKILNDGKRNMELEDMALFGDPGGRGTRIPVPKFTIRINQLGLQLIEYGLNGKN